ncbi:hypothetical protein [Leptothoe sp. PORK10 BA2]|uniref:hypothetical protein n=1 Tax=Leptothoe sp. PORK10 BA2 TaxID=3110254 RepID=UPI002B1E9493|nr:hypothetical protein [Leptothoe sp. PORK10 BA2]MEA5462130.1 hypothetical protein [Leptothoe sp. PORK10 BA2]
MVTLSTADRFLGSLLGTYLGHSYVNQHPWNCLQTKDSQLYQSWLQDMQQDPPPGPTGLDFSPAIALPWFLYHHADHRTRHGWIAQTLAADALPQASHATVLMYCLGDSLEWLMQCPRTVQHPLPLLCEHLQRQIPTYPPGVVSQVNQLIAWLAPEPAKQSAILSPSTATSPLHSISPLEADVPMAAMALAIRQCLNYRENLALALTGQSGQPIPTIIGCLMGAWGGAAVIPTPWIMSLSPESRQHLRHIVQHLYRHWAGIRCLGNTAETLPLDL